MKKIFSIAVLAVSALTLWQCTNEPIEEEITPSVQSGFEFEVSADGTRLTLDGRKSVWESGDQVLLAALENGSTETQITGLPYTFVSGNKFRNEEASIDTGKQYRFYAMYPYDSTKDDVFTDTGKSRGYMQVGGDLTQKGESADHIYSAAPMVWASNDFIAPDGLNANLQHTVALMDFKVVNKSGAPLTVASLTFSAPEGTYIGGTYNIMFETAECISSGNSKYYTSTATVTVEDAPAVANGGTFHVYLPIAPVTFAAGSTVSISVADSNGKVCTLEKPLSAEVEFERGKVYAQSISFENPQAPAVPTGNTYTLVSTLAEVTAGDYIIVTDYQNEGDLCYVANTSAAAGNVALNTLVADGTTLSGSTITTTKSDISWMFTPCGNNTYYINSTSNTDLGIYLSNASDGVSVSQLGKSLVWTIGESKTTNWTFSALDNKGSNRYLAIYKADNIRCYTSSATNQNGSFRLYKKSSGTATAVIECADIDEVPSSGVTNAKATITLKNVTESVKATVDGTVVTAASVSGTTLTYSVSANTGSERSGKITLTANGATCEITVSQFSAYQKYFHKVTSFDGPGTYLIVADINSTTYKAAAPIDGDVSYANGASVTVIDGNKIAATTFTNQFTWSIKSAGGSEYVLQDNELRYYYSTETDARFMCTYSLGTADEGYTWWIGANGDGTFTICNTVTGRWMQYGANGYDSFSCYVEDKSTCYPSLYKLDEEVTDDPSAEPTTITWTSFSDIADKMDDVISYSCAKGNGTTAPIVKDGEIRLYQMSSASTAGGGNITIMASAGHTIESITIGSSLATSYTYTVGDSTVKSATQSLKADATTTIEVGARSVTVYCMTTDSKNRFYVNHLSVTYK